MFKQSIIILTLCIGLSSCTEENTQWKEATKDPILVHSAVDKLTETIVFDVFSPPVSARVYAYPCIAAYETMVYDSDKYTSLEGKLNGLSGLPKPDPSKEYSFEIAALTAFVETSNYGIFTEEKMDAFQDSLTSHFKEIGVPEEVLTNSHEFGKKIATHIIAWADGDLYKETRSYPRYTPIKSDTAYALTPPDFVDPLEPHWEKIRPMIMDSASQFIPVRPYRFSLDPKSDFYKSVMYVYDISQKLTEEEKQIAKFWDNNPYIVEHHGHMMIGVKKVGPAGHWLGIAGMAGKEHKTDFSESIATYAYTSIAFFDAFISAFDEKYRSEYIRPETFINLHIDHTWKPYIQTPPFPEYTSAHSVTSASAATVLTSLFGNEFSFVDSVEVPFGQTPRELNSFLEAAQEASMSRLYGGIHYLPSLDNGNLQGRKLGAHIVDELGIKSLNK